MGWESQGKDNLAETGEKPQIKMLPLKKGLLIDRFPGMLKARNVDIFQHVL